MNVTQEDGNLIDCASAVVATALGVVRRRAVEYDSNTGMLRFASFFSLNFTHCIINIVFS